MRSNATCMDSPTIRILRDFRVTIAAVAAWLWLNVSLLAFVGSMSVNDTSLGASETYLLPFAWRVYAVIALAISYVVLVSAVPRTIREQAERAGVLVIFRVALLTIALSALLSGPGKVF